MPLTSVSLTTAFTPAMYRTNNGFGSTTASPTATTFNLSGINVATWNQAFEQIYTLFTSAPSGLTATLASGGSLTAGTTYFYKVTAVGYNGFSSTNETSGSNEPAGVAATSGNQTINLSWTALPGAVSYNIYRGTATGAENVLVGNTTLTTFTDNGTAATTSQTPPGSMPNDYIEFDLSSFTTLANETATPGHLLTLIIQPTGTAGSSQATLAPGSSNGLSGLFGGTSPTLALRVNGTFVFSGPPTGDAGVVISSTSKTLRVTNGGTAATTVQVSALVGP